MDKWVLVANAGKAEVFEVNRNGKEIRKVIDLDFPGAREKGIEKVTDRPGRNFDRPIGGISRGRHSYSEVDLHAQEMKEFAHQIADILLKQQREGVFERLDIVASPQFLGELRRAFSPALRESIEKEVNKDISGSLSENERIEMFCKFLEIERPVYVPRKG